MWMVCAMDLFTAIHTTLEARLTSPRLLARFAHWVLIHEALAVIGDLEKLVEDAGGESRLDVAIDQALGALCIQAAAGGPEGRADDDAACLLLAVLLEPLVRRSKDRDVAGVLDVEDVQAELVAGVWEAIVSVTPDCSNVSNLLINAGRRRVRAAAKRELDHQLRRRRLGNAVADLSEPGTADCPEQVIGLARAEGVLNPVEADLIAATRLEPAEPPEVASLLGLSERAAFLRRDRGEARLLAWLGGAPLPPRRAAPARRELLGLFGFQAVSDLRDSTVQSSHVVEREEVKTHRDGSVGQSSRRSDATKPSRVSQRDGR
jgi:hypothetical protein